MITAMRECATNAVRHVGATELYIRVTNVQGIAGVRITNNGTSPEGPVSEGGGLSALRARVEKAGGDMEVRFVPNFELTVSVPITETAYDKKKHGKRYPAKWAISPGRFHCQRGAGGNVLCRELVRGSVEETLNELLEQEAERLTQTARYERSEVRQGYRSGHFDRNLTAVSGDVTLHVPRLKGVSFETAIIERHRCLESSVEEALRMHLSVQTRVLQRSTRDD